MVFADNTGPRQLSVPSPRIGTAAGLDADTRLGGLSVGTTFGKYTICACSARAWMGEVYEAYDADKGRTVALKILADEYSHDENFRTRFQREPARRRSWLNRT